MVKITEVTYSRGQTLQLVQFEPTNIHYSIKAEVGEGEDPKAVYAAIKKEVDDLIAIDVTVLQGNTGKIVRAAAKIVNEESPF